MQDSGSKASLSTAPMGGGRRSGANRRDSTARSPSAPWPPPWAAPPWPPWNDADVSKEPWDLGKVPVPRDPFLMPLDETSESPTTSKEKRGSEKGGPRASKSKARASITSDEMYLPFDDPLGPGALPASLARRVRGWVRGSAVPRVALLAPSEDEDYGANARELPDLTTAAAYALRLSPLLRYMVASIRALYVMGMEEPIPLEPSDDYEPEIKSPWRPWHHIYSLCEATNTHPPTPQLNPAGKYVVRLFFLGTWRRITVDDRIPEDNLGRPLLPVILPTVDPAETEAADGGNGANDKGKGKGKGKNGKTNGKANGKAKNGDKGKGKGKAADGEENELGEGESLRIWPAILCKALLRVASLSWRGGVDDGECGELAGFSAVACLTGWVPQRLDLRGVVPSVAWALVHRLLGEDVEDPAQQYLGYVSPEEQAEAKKKAEDMLIPSKYNFPKKPPPPPPPLEIPLKDECLWEQQSIADPTAERLSPAAVMAILREDLRLTPPALPCTVPCTASGTSTSSFDWGWLGSDTSLASLHGGEQEEEEEQRREEEGEEEGEEEETSEMRKKREKEEAERMKKEKKRKEEEEQAQAEHKALAPRWSHPALLTEARLFFDEDTSRPPTPLWQRHRWKAWAIERGLIPPERVRVERRVRVYAPLCGSVKIPPPPAAPGPLHPPIPPLPLPLGYPFKEFPPGVTEPVELGLDKIKDKKQEKKESLSKGGKNDPKTTEDKSGKNDKQGAWEGEAPWIRFDVLQPEILAIEVFYRPSTFAFKARLTSLVPANVQAQGAVLGVESSGGPRKSVAKVKDVRIKSPGAESRVGLDKLPMPPEEFSCEPVFFLMDAINCKKVLFQLSVIADDVLHSLNILLQASNPEKPWLLQEAQVLSGPLKPYEHCTQTKNASSGHLVAETYRWAEAGLGGAAFALKTNGACAMVVNVGEGLAVFRLWVKAPRHFSLLVLSPTTFALGGRGPVHGIMMKESESYLSRGAALAAAYTALMAEVGSAPPLLRPPTPESNEYKKAALLGKEEGKHAQALKAFFEALLPPIMPELTPTKMELIWNRLMHRLEEALVPLVLEQVATPEECARGIRQWQVALQEPFFGAATLATFEDPDRPNPRRTTSPPSQSGGRSSPPKAKRKGGDSIEEEEGPMPVEELAGATRLYLGLDAPDAARAHPAKDECDVDAPARPESEETKETSTESGESSEKEKQFRLSTLSDLGEPVISIDDDMAITVLKRMLTDHPELLFLYPFRNDHLLRIYCTEYQGTTKIVSNRWVVLARCVINPHQEQPVLCAVFASVTGFPMPWVIMVDNSTMQPVAASSRYGAVEPSYIKKSEMGYTVLVVIEVAPSVKELPWLLRFAATKPEDLVHYCSAQTPTPSNAGNRSSTSKGSQLTLNKERRSNRASARDGGFPGRKGSASAAPPPSPAMSTPASPECPGPQPPPQLLQLVIDGLYTAPSDAIVTSAILRLPLSGAWVPTLLLSFHIRLSSPQAKFRFTVEDIRTDKILLQTSSVGHKTIPAFFAPVPHPVLDIEEQEKKPTSTNLTEAMLRADAATAGIRLVAPTRGASAFRLSGVGVVLILRLTVFVRVGDWPLSPHEFDNVDEAKEKERRESRLFGDEILGGEEEDEGLGSTFTKRPPPPSSEHGGAGSPASAVSSLLDEESTPRFLLAVVVDADKVPGADLTSDVPRALCLRMLKESWEAEQPGRHLVANKARQDFLRRREEGEHLLAAAEMAAAAVEGALDLEDVKADILDMLINRGAWPSSTMVPASLASPPPLTSPGRLAATAAAAATYPSKSPPAPPPTTGSSVTTATTASSISGGLPDAATIAAERPVVRTLEDMLEEMIEEAYAKEIISDPLGREHVTPLEIQLDHLDVEKKIDSEKLMALELFRDVKYLRGVQVRIGTFAEASLSRSETQAAEAALAAKENRDKAIADSKGKGKEPDKDRKSRKSTLGKK